MEDKVKDQETETEGKEKTVSKNWKETLQGYYVLFACSVFAAWALLSGTVTNIHAQSELNIDSAEIVGGFFDGANLVLGLGGLIAVLALPYGIQFAFNFIQGIFSKFSSIRFGG